MITENAFVNCPLLKTVNLGTPRLAAGMKGGALQRCFSGCESLKEINCKQGRVFLIGTYADSETLTDANLPSNFAIHGDCFARCRNLKKAAIAAAIISAERFSQTAYPLNKLPLQRLYRRHRRRNVQRLQIARKNRFARRYTFDRQARFCMLRKTVGDKRSVTNCIRSSDGFRKLQKSERNYGGRGQLRIYAVGVGRILLGSKFSRRRKVLFAQCARSGHESV